MDADDITGIAGELQAVGRAQVTDPPMEREQLPLGLRLLGFAAAVLFAVWWLAGLSRRSWAARSPSPSHPYGVRFKGGQVFYFSDPVGIFMDHFLWVFFLVLGIVLAWELMVRIRARARE